MHAEMTVALRLDRARAIGPARFIVKSSCLIAPPRGLHLGTTVSRSAKAVAETRRRP